MKLFLHPGIEKTATTTFQRNLFDRHSEIINIGKPWTDETFNLRKEIHKNDNFDFVKVKKGP
jgi:hypothetical protein